MRKLERQLVTLEFLSKKNGHVRITHLGMLNFTWLICFIYSCPNGLGTLGRHWPGPKKHGPGPVRKSTACLVPVTARCRARAWDSTAARSAGPGTAWFLGWHDAA